MTFFLNLSLVQKSGKIECTEQDLFSHNLLVVRWICEQKLGNWKTYKIE